MVFVANIYVLRGTSEQQEVSFRAGKKWSKKSGLIPTNHPGTLRSESTRYQHLSISAVNSSANEEKQIKQNKTVRLKVKFNFEDLE